MPPKKAKGETGVVAANKELWSPAILSAFLAQQSSRPQKDFRKTAFFNLLDADALALLQAFFEVKSPAGREFFYQQPWPGRDELTLIPGSPQWKDRVREYIRQAAMYAARHVGGVTTPTAHRPAPNSLVGTYYAPGPSSISELSNQGNGPTQVNGRGGNNSNLNPRAWQQGVSSAPETLDPVQDAMTAAIAANNQSGGSGQNNNSKGRGFSGSSADQRAGHFGE
jgi:hypothetical protein